MITTSLKINDILPLTCSRTGTCCHGKQVLLNPWELYCLAREKKMTTREFRDLYCDFGGIQLRFDGKPGWKAQKACSQYVDNFGCSVHLGRPLSCRLYPLGRQIQSKKAHYIFQGKEFPCLEGCPIVTELPQLSVGEYLEGQQAHSFEIAQDIYLDVMQSIADIAFVLLLETGLAQSGERQTLDEWHKMGKELPEEIGARLGREWIDCLMLPEIQIQDPISFAKQHLELIQYKAQEKFGILQINQQLHESSVLMMGVALHLARGIGANPQDMSELWVETAKNHGAMDSQIHTD